MYERFDPLYYKSVNELSLVNNTNYPVKKLGEVANMQRGRFGHRPRNDPKFYGGEYPFIQTGNVVEASKSNSRIKYTQTLNELGLLTSRLFMPEVLVITIAANIGDTAILDYPACFPDSLIALTPKSDINIYYLNYYLRLIKNYIENLAPQAAQKNINQRQLFPIPVIVPPASIQGQIVSKLNEAYDLKRQKEEEIELLSVGIDAYILSELGITLEQQNNTLENRMFTTSFSDVVGLRLDPLYFKNKVKMESDIYENVPLRRLAKISKGQSITKDKVKEGIYPVIAGGQTSPYNHSEYNFEGNVITVSASGAYSGYVWYHKSPIFASDCNVIMSKNENETSTEYIFYVLKALQSEIYKLQQGAGQPHVYARDLEKLTVPLAPKSLQVQILQTINNIQSKINSLQDEASNILKDTKMEVEEMILG